MCWEGGLAVRGVLCVGVAAGFLLLSVTGFAQPGGPGGGTPPNNECTPCWLVADPPYPWDFEDRGFTGSGSTNYGDGVASASAFAEVHGFATAYSEATINAFGLCAITKTEETCPDLSVSGGSNSEHAHWGITFDLDTGTAGEGTSDWVSDLVMPGDNDRWDGSPYTVQMGGPPQCSDTGDFAWRHLEAQSTFTDSGTVKLYLFVASYATACAPLIGHALTITSTDNRGDFGVLTQELP